MAGTDPNEQPSGTRESVSVLAGRLARDLAVLVRLELEETAARGSGRLRALIAEVVALAMAGVALLLGLAGLSLAAVFALETRMRPWQAALLVGSGWLLVGALLSFVVAKRLRSRACRQLPADRLQASAQAEADMAATAEALLELLAAQVARHEEARLSHTAAGELGTVGHELAAEAASLETDVGEVEAEIASALEELVEIVTLPGRAGIKALRRLLP
jgi:endonuclease/exonuclease/phosphatase (EEP) superfamily protein YafD